MSSSLTIDRELTLSQQARIVRRCRNTSGLELWTGDSVVLDTTNSSATDICITLSNTADDKKAKGVVLQTIAPNDYGKILFAGPTAVLKVDGNTDIAKGDKLAIIDGATYPDYATGDVAVNAAGTTVTGNGTTFTAAMKGRKIYFGSETLTYRITAVGGATSLTIDPPYRGTVNISGSAYNITAKGIAMKASAGKGGAFATALEVYQTNDSYGVVDCELFQAPGVDSTASQGVVGDMAAAGTAATNAAGASATYASIAHVHALGTHTHTSATTGATLGTTAFPADTFTADAAGRLPFKDGIWTTAKLAAGILSADATGRALVAAGWLNVATFQSGVAAGILTADATGRAFMVAGYFNAAHVATAFETNSFDATNCADIFADNAIPGSKVNWSYGATASTIAPDDSAAAGTAATVSRSDHVHANTCAAPSAGLAAADAEGAASTFARSNHVHKAVVTDNVSFFFGASDDCGILFSTTPLQDAMVVFADDVSRSIHICDATSKAVDFNVAVATDPTVFIHCATNPATEYVKISVDGTTATIQAVGNTLDLIGVGSVTVNVGKADINFAVATDNLAYAIYSDGGKDSLVLGSNTDTSSADQLITVSRAARTATAATSYYDLIIAPAGAVTTPGGASTHAVIATVRINEPNITKTGGDTVTLAATVYIPGAPTEGSTNSSLYVEAGTTHLLGGVAVAADAVDISLGASADVLMRWSTADADNHAFALGLGTSEAMHICLLADIATDWNVAADTNPSLYVHSATTPATDYVKIYHDATTAAFYTMGATQVIVGIQTVTELLVTATAVNLCGNVLQGSEAANGDLTLTATSHGTLTTAYIVATEMINATAGGVATIVKAGVPGQGDFAQTLLEGTMAIDSTNGRIYFYHSAAFHYVNQTAGFEIPVEEVVCPVCNKQMQIGQRVIGQLDSTKTDGALHGKYQHEKCPA